MPVSVLNINDDPKVEWLLEEGLGGEFVLHSARDGIEGLYAIGRRQPDIILLNLQMPRADGFWVLTQMEHLKIMIPVVILSHYERNYVSERTKGYRVDGFILGSWVVDDVRNEIVRILGE